MNSQLTACQYTAYKNKQWEAIEAAQTSDVLAVLPTGYGKTVIIQSLPYTKETPGCVVVANPLNAIIMEQSLRFGSACVVINQRLVEVLKQEPTDFTVVDKATLHAKKLREGDVSFIIGQYKMQININFI